MTQERYDEIIELEREKDELIATMASLDSVKWEVTGWVKYKRQLALIQEKLDYYYRIAEWD